MKVGLALGSGGARGYAHIPYLEAIDELGIGIGIMSGASMGAFLGAYYAAGMPAREMHRMVSEFNRRTINRMVDFSGLHEPGIIKGKKFEAYLRASLPVKRFEDLAIPLRIVATDYRSKQQVVFDHGDLIPAIRASISVPGIFQPYRYGDQLLVDGGIVNPVPFDLLAGTADYVIGIDVSGSPSCVTENIPGPIEAILGAFGIMEQTIINERAHDLRMHALFRPSLDNFSSIDLNRAEEIMAAVGTDVAEFKRALIQQGIDRLAARTA